MSEFTLSMLVHVRNGRFPTGRTETFITHQQTTSDLGPIPKSEMSSEVQYGTEDDFLIRISTTVEEKDENSAMLDFVKAGSIHLKNTCASPRTYANLHIREIVDSKGDIHDNRRLIPLVGRHLDGTLACGSLSRDGVILAWFHVNKGKESRLDVAWRTPTTCGYYDREMYGYPSRETVLNEIERDVDKALFEGKFPSPSDNGDFRRCFVDWLAGAGILKRTRETDEIDPIKGVKVRTKNMAMPDMPWLLREDENFVTALRTEVTSRLAMAAQPLVSTLDKEALDIANETLPSLVHHFDPMMLDDRIYAAFDSTFDERAPFRKAVLHAPVLFGLIARFVAVTKNELPDWKSLVEDAITLYLDTHRIPKREPKAENHRLTAAFSTSMPAILRAEKAVEEVKNRFELARKDRLLRFDINANARRRTHTSTELACALLRVLPPNWVPTDEQQWLHLSEIAVPIFSATWFMFRPADMAEFISAKGDWTATKNKLLKAAGLDLKTKYPANDLSSAIGDMRDMLKDFATQILTPANLLAGHDRHAMSYHEAAHVFSKGRTLTTLLATSSEWHARQASIDDRIARISPEIAPRLEWPAGLPEWKKDGIVLKVLTSVSELADEGRPGANRDGSEGLHHCVAGYGDACLRKGRRIVSLRDISTGLRLSTAEISSRDGILEIRQHRGKNNTTPNEAEASVLAAYITALNDEELAVDKNGLQPIGSSDDAVMAARYDFRKTGAWEEVFDMWKRFITPAARNWTPDEFSRFADMIDNGVVGEKAVALVSEEAEKRRHPCEEEASSPTP